jgi:hypothetical protein
MINCPAGQQISQHEDKFLSAIAKKLASFQEKVKHVAEFESELST